MKLTSAAVAGLVIASVGWAQVTERVSISSAGVQGDSDSGPSAASVSADGRFVVFDSYASNLVPGDTNYSIDVFVRDRMLNTLERVSVDSGGSQGDFFSYAGVISADGRYVAFMSAADNLVPGDTNHADDVFVRDRLLGTTERVSVDSSGAEGNDGSGYPSISADGRYVAFDSRASNLVPGDTNLRYDVFVRDRTLGTTTRISISSTGAEGDYDSREPSISGDGHFVAFSSAADNLVPGDTNNWQDIFVRDVWSNTTERVTISYNGGQSNNDSFGPVISADGRCVAFESRANNFVPGDTGPWQDIFVRDRQLSSTERVSISSTGIEGNGESELPSISGDGLYVGFWSQASNLVPGDSNGTGDVFLRNRARGITELVSIDSNGIQGNNNSGFSAVSWDGRFVAFGSRASNLVLGDTNGVSDVFVRDRESSGFISFCDPGAGGVLACPCSNPSSSPDRGCNNSAGTGGATLSASGTAYLSMDSLVFTTSAEKPTATSVLLQGTAAAASGIVYGQGVRCVAGTLKRLFTKHAVAGSITAPDFAAGDPTVSTRSAAAGDVIQPGESRYYLVYYRDPVVLGGCPASATFNATQTGEVTWWP